MVSATILGNMPSRTSLIPRKFLSRFGDVSPVLAALWLSVAVGAAQQAPSPDARVILITRQVEALSTALDAGPAPSSQRLTLTITLAPSEAQTAALDEFLAAVGTPGSPSYRQWVTPKQFAATYGATTEQIAAASAWLEAQGLRVDGVSPAGMRLTVSGFAAQVEAAFAVAVHNYEVAGHHYFANVAQPSLPAEVAGLFSSIEGLDNLPLDAATSPAGPDGTPATFVNGRATALTVANLAEVVDQNATGLLTIDGTAGLGVAPASRVAGFEAVMRQAAAQGMTTLLARSAASGNFPSTLPEVTVLTSPGDAADASTPIATRPTWQIAPGLPMDGLRYGPDLTVPSLTDFAQTISTIALKANGGRLGNINPILYELGPTPGLYTQPDDAAAGTWEPATGLGLVNREKLQAAFPAGTGTSSLQISSSAGAPVHGQSFTLTATVTSTNGGPVPLGTITFSSGQSGFPGATVALNGSGSAQWTSNQVPGGTYTVTAAYSGDANYAAESGTITFTVQPEAANFSISAPSSVALGSTVTGTVTVSSVSGVGTPNVTVTVTPSGISGATAISQTLSGASGTATGQFTFTTRQAGNVALQASCSSNDSSFSCYTPQTANVTVPQATPTVTLSISPTSPTAGQQVTFTATVSGVTGVGATGTVQFFDGATAIGSGSAPTATYTGTLAPGSSHSLTAVYQGDGNYVKATSNAVPLSVAQAPTTTTVNASTTSATFGQNVTLTITVTPSTVVNGTQPTGTLTFTGAGAVTSATVTGGSASVTLSSLAVGQYTITTSYSGDNNYTGSTGNTVVLTITQAVASLSSSLSSYSFTTGSTATLTTTVTLPGNAQLPSGSTFVATIVGVSGASYTGTFNINPGGNTGTGQVTILAPIAGSYTLQVTCPANAAFTCTPSSLAITSTATTGSGPGTGTTPTTTTLTINPTTPVAGQAVVFTATVSAAASAVAANPITGTVNFYDGTTLIGSGTISTVGPNGVATATISLTAATTSQSLTAVYQGNTVYASSTSPAISVTLSAVAASIVLSSNVTTTIAGTSVVLTATVTGSTITGLTPTGTVSFYIAGTTPALIGKATVGTAGNGVGVAVFSTSNLPSGSLTLYATYNGDNNFSSATSNSITLGLSDYTVNFTPQTLTLTQGQSGSAIAVVSLVNGFPGTVILGCTPPPDLLITCSFSPEVITGAGTATLTVTTTAAKKAAVEGGPRSSFGVAAGVTLAALLCCVLPAGRRRMPGLLLLLLALGITMNLGCSGSNSISPVAIANSGTPLGTTLLTINTAGTNGTIQVRHNYTYQVTIQ
jgi:hypothetical protein